MVTQVHPLWFYSLPIAYHSVQLYSHLSSKVQLTPFLVHWCMFLLIVLLKIKNPLLLIPKFGFENPKCSQNQNIFKTIMKL